jgi:hypothetical protein
MEANGVFACGTLQIVLWLAFTLLEQLLTSSWMDFHASAACSTSPLWRLCAATACEPLATSTLASLCLCWSHRVVLQQPEQGTAIVRTVWRALGSRRDMPRVCSVCERSYFGYITIDQDVE